MKVSLQLAITSVLMLVVMWLLPAPWFYFAGLVALFLSLLSQYQFGREQRK